ncbi:MAG: hypothetical protein HY815_15005 [Candidatus Riflebacteria bacterium]|nr:hypothetical protein [Candidatus Riflebacteria bacterium]
MKTWRFVVRWLRVLDDLLEVFVVGALRLAALGFRRGWWLVPVVVLATLVVGLKLGERLTGRHLYVGGVLERPGQAVIGPRGAPTPERLDLFVVHQRPAHPSKALRPFVDDLAGSSGADLAALKQAARARIVDRWSPVVRQFVASVGRLCDTLSAPGAARDFAFKVDLGAAEEAYSTFLGICVETIRFELERDRSDRALAVFTAWLELLAFLEASPASRPLRTLLVSSEMRAELFARAFDPLARSRLAGPDRRRLSETLKRTTPSLLLLSGHVEVEADRALLNYGKRLNAWSGSSLSLWPYFGHSRIPVDRDGRGRWVAQARQRLAVASRLLVSTLDREVRPSGRWPGPCTWPRLGWGEWLAGSLWYNVSLEAVGTRTAGVLADGFIHMVNSAAHQIECDRTLHLDAVARLGSDGAWIPALPPAVEVCCAAHGGGAGSGRRLDVVEGLCSDGPPSARHW